MTQLVGRFPVFGKSGKLGSHSDTSGSVVPNTFPAYYLNNKLAYEKGFTVNPSKEQLNGIFGFITNALSDLYTRGVPQFTLNLAYPKGAVVSFNGNLYVSLCDDNTVHISQKSHWGKVKYENQYQVDTEEQIDDLPIGTILTVPMTTKRAGYIDYVEGQRFNATMYPKLYQALGSDLFALSGSNRSNDILPIGSCIHVLSSNPQVPEGYIEWNNTIGSLRQYPELKQELERVAQHILEPRVKQEWLSALQRDSLPLFDSFYLGLGSVSTVGMMDTDTTRREELLSLPAVVDNSNTLNPMGMTRCVAEEQNHSVVTGMNVSHTTLNSNIVVTALRADQLNANVDKRGYRLTVGNGDVTKPRTLYTRIFVKATNPRPSAISSTHKQIIKAFN